MKGDIATAERLLRDGADVNDTTVGNQTALHVAAAEGQDKMVLWLLAHEADPLAEDDNGETPADFADSQGKKGTARLVGEHVKRFKQIEEAIGEGDAKALRALLAKDPRKITLLHVLAQHGALDEAEDEIKAGADVNARTVIELTPLHKSVLGEEPKLTKLLLEAGADINARDVHSRTPLFVAAALGQLEIAEVLLKAGADTTVRDVQNKETALEFAKGESDEEMVALLERYQRGGR